jgi:hypothetical protein
MSAAAMSQNYRFPKQGLAKVRKGVDAKGWKMKLAFVGLLFAFMPSMLGMAWLLWNHVTDTK